MKRITFCIILNSLVFISVAQQVAIPRIEAMPNLPSPYVMRDWKKVAIDYDNFIFDVTKNGTYLPLISISSLPGINYSNIQDIKMDTYVGQNNHGNVAEAINIIPSVVGASLVGVDKTNQFGVNWVEKVKDFYNLKNGQNIYLNNYSTSTGNDWWYEVMPNIFFYQLYSLYPNVDSDFFNQFTSIADRELDVLYKLGGKIQPWTIPNMNFRAFNLSTNTPNNTSVPEPETAGSIAWILYQAYVKTNDMKYLQGSELALDFLNSWSSNPSYEIQLPYGIYTATRMNAIEGTNYDITKMLNWTFSSGLNTLRGWGTIVGKWNGYDVSGLIGEANDAGNDYAFLMNGFQHASALVPVAKYDKRYARAIGKWILNLSNASRLFYKNGLPVYNQETSSYAWDNQFDSNNCIPFESMKQTWNNVSPFAMGDAVKGNWAKTNLSLYSGSSVGYLASIISTTNVSGILQINLNKTDFNGNNTYPTFLYYNPYTTSQTVSISLPSGNFDIYDAISETDIRNNVSGSTNFSIDADNVRILVIYPSGKTSTINGRFKSIENNIIDYHWKYNYSSPLRIKSFSSSDTIVQKNYSLELLCLVENNSSENLTYDWYQNNIKIASTHSNTYNWISPSTPGYYQLKCIVSDNETSTSTNIEKIKVVDYLNISPIISDINFDSTMPFEIGKSVSVRPNLNTPNVDYIWSVTSGNLDNSNSNSPNWKLPSTPGVYNISLTVNNTSGSNSFSKSVLVKNFTSFSDPTPLIYYPFNGDTYNHAQSNFNAVSVNAISTIGANGITNGAYQFPNNSAYIYTPNNDNLNFTDKITLSFWIKPDLLPNYEQFIISHGSWEERYKVSITPERKVRWTLKTINSVVDVDADTITDIGKYVHYTAIYTGYSMELYRNGKLSNFKALTGNIKTTSKNLTIARKDDSTTDYNYVGSIDEVRIYNSDISQNLIKILPIMFSLNSKVENIYNKNMIITPNPFKEKINLNLGTNEIVKKINLFDTLGHLIYTNIGNNDTLDLSYLKKGVYLIDVETNQNNYKSKLIKN